MTAVASTPALAARRSEVVYLYAARAARGIGDGFAFIILPAYLSELGFNPFQIGVVATAALLGTAATTLAVGFLASRYDLRNLLLIGAAVMVLTGLAVANFHALAAIVIIVFLGSLNPSTGDLGMIVPLEHAMLARGAQDEERTRVFARYSLIGAASTAAGALAAATPDLLVSLGTARLAALEVMFYLYAALGAIGALLYRRLPHVSPQHMTAGTAGLGPSRRTVYKLAALFSLDAFAGGFVVPSILALWLFERFDLSLAVASVFFFWTNVLSALSYPVAARLARRFGLVNTMVFTHIPSSLCLVLAAFSPNLPIVLGLLLVRAALAQMDVPTRTSYVMAVVTPAERTAAASVTAVPRTLASSVSPVLSGALLATSFASLPLVACGVLKIVYDIALLLSFRHVKPPEERGTSGAS
jgi:MFS family permease